jgi:hypothetical protein
VQFRETGDIEFDFDQRTCAPRLAGTAQPFRPHGNGRWCGAKGCKLVARRRLVSRSEGGSYRTTRWPATDLRRHFVFLGLASSRFVKATRANGDGNLTASDLNDTHGNDHNALPSEKLRDFRGAAGLPGSNRPGRADRLARHLHLRSDDNSGHLGRSVNHLSTLRSSTHSSVKSLSAVNLSKLSPRYGDQRPSRDTARFTSPGRVGRRGTAVPAIRSQRGANDAVPVHRTSSQVRGPGWRTRRANRVLLFWPPGSLLRCHLAEQPVAPARRQL